MLEWSQDASVIKILLDNKNANKKPKTEGYLNVDVLWKYKDMRNYRFV